MSSMHDAIGDTLDVQAHRYEGQRVGNYTMRRVLGAGGMGVVYLAEHPEMGSRAAVKVLRRHGPDDAEAVGRFLNEARAAAAVQHPHVVKIFDMGRFDDGAPYILMECLEGEALSARLTRGPLPVSDALTITEQVGRALQAMHDKNIVHRDLKPHNIFLVHQADSSQVFAKVLDFGVAKLRGVQHEEWAVDTAAGVVLGTPRYMAPECWDGSHPGGPASDQYALSMVLWEMLAGRPVHKSRLSAVMANERLSDAPTLHRLRADVSPALELVLLRAMSPEPDDRFDDVAEMLAALSLARATPTTLPARQGLVANKRRRARAIVVWSTVAALAAGVALFWLGLGKALRQEDAPVVTASSAAATTLVSPVTPARPKPAQAASAAPRANGSGANEPRASEPGASVVSDRRDAKRPRPAAPRAVRAVVPAAPRPSTSDDVTPEPL